MKSLITLFALFYLSSCQPADNPPEVKPDQKAEQKKTKSVTYSAEQLACHTELEIMLRKNGINEKYLKERNYSRPLFVIHPPADKNFILTTNDSIPNEEIIYRKCFAIYRRHIAKSGAAQAMVLKKEVEYIVYFAINRRVDFYSSDFEFIESCIKQLEKIDPANKQVPLLRKKMTEEVLTTDFECEG